MAAITRLGSSGYGVKRAGSFAGKTATAAAAPKNVGAKIVNVNRLANP